MSFDTPILFIIFNSPEQTRHSFEAIRRIKPSKLYVAADGPRVDKESDKQRCQETREIINYIDWDCDLQTLFRENNLGCGKGPADAISWLFEKEEIGIILEDDCIPDNSFFAFCHELLNKYLTDTRIMHIAGTNHNPNYLSYNDYSYFFSQVGHMLGWAT